jgi:hypothetical protein
LDDVDADGDDNDGTAWFPLIAVLDSFGLELDERHVRTWQVHIETCAHVFWLNALEGDLSGCWTSLSEVDSCIDGGCGDDDADDDDATATGIWLLVDGERFDRFPWVKWTLIGLKHNNIDGSINERFEWIHEQLTW